MKLHKILIPGILSILLITSCSKDEPVEPIEKEIDKLEKKSKYSDIELEILVLVNKHRESIGKSALVMNEFIYNESVGHSLDMAKTNHMSHDGADQRFSRMAKELGGYGSAENVAYGYRTAKAVVDGWLNSPGHRTNIEGNYNITGIAARKNDNGVYYYTHLFHRTK